MKSSVFLQGLAAVCIAATASAVSGQTRHPAFQPGQRPGIDQGTGYGANENVFNTTNLNLTCTVARSRQRFHLRPTAPEMCWSTTSSPSA